MLKLMREWKKGLQLTKPAFTMGWCIECHNKKEIDFTSSGYYEEIHNRLKLRADVNNKIFEDDKVTVKELGVWNVLNVIINKY